MKWIIVGLGNPADEYASTRHNVGKDMVKALRAKLPTTAKVVDLNAYMNNSGAAIKKAVGTPKGLVVVHDELDLPLGRVKVSFGNSAGGHNGVKSIIAALKTQDFTRIRVGISPSTPSGKLKKPDAEKIVDFVLGKFKPAEQEKLKKVQKTVAEALQLLIEDGPAAAMNVINTK